MQRQETGTEAGSQGERGAIPSGPVGKTRARSAAVPGPASCGLKLSIPVCYLGTRGRQGRCGFKVRGEPSQQLEATCWPRVHLLRWRAWLAALLCLYWACLPGSQSQRRVRGESAAGLRAERGHGWLSASVTSVPLPHCSEGHRLEPLYRWHKPRWLLSHWGRRSNGPPKMCTFLCLEPLNMVPSMTMGH